MKYKITITFETRASSAEVRQVAREMLVRLEKVDFGRGVMNPSASAGGARE